MEKPDVLAEDAVWDPEGSELIDFAARKEEGDWVWCASCRKAYEVGWYRPKGSKQMCPYPDCSGDAVLDPMEYRLNGEPEYGEIVM
jgi:hypothetical protein